MIPETLSGSEPSCESGAVRGMIHELLPVHEAVDRRHPVIGQRFQDHAVDRDGRRRRLLLESRKIIDRNCHFDDRRRGCDQINLLRWRRSSAAKPE